MSNGERPILIFAGSCARTTSSVGRRSIIERHKGRLWATSNEGQVLDVRGPQRFAQQRVGAEVNHADGQIVAGPPVGIPHGKLARHQDVSDVDGICAVIGGV